MKRPLWPNISFNHEIHDWNYYTTWYFHRNFLKILPQNLMRMEKFEICILKLKGLISRKLLDQLKSCRLCMYSSGFRARQQRRSLAPVWMMIIDVNDGQMIFGDLRGLKLPDICLTGEEKPRKDRGSNPGPLCDRRACYHLVHSGGQLKSSFKFSSFLWRRIGSQKNHKT